VGNDRPALIGQLSAGITIVIEEFIAGFEDAVRELRVGQRLAHFLDPSKEGVLETLARDAQAREYSTAYNYK
jgi:hypothetical protein